MEGYHEIAVADYVVVVMKLLKGNGAKDLACLVSRITDNQNLGRSVTMKRDHSQCTIGISKV